jgi:hypothetical protein
MKKLAAVTSSTVFALTACLLTVQSLSAIDADDAKKCRALAIKAHPTPVAGSKPSGVEQAQRSYFRACVSRVGKEEKKEDKQQK